MHRNADSASTLSHQPRPFKPSGTTTAIVCVVLEAVYSPSMSLSSTASSNATSYCAGFQVTVPSFVGDLHRFRLDSHLLSPIYT